MASPANLFELFGAMESSPYTFHLTGSRYMDTHRVDSDWDFFTPRSPQCRDWLYSHDFVDVLPSEPCYDDYSVCMVLTHKLDVDIQLIKPEFVEKKLWARDVIKSLNIRLFTRGALRDLWSAVLKSDKTLYSLDNPNTIEALVREGHLALFAIPKLLSPTS